ncbi:MAG: alpha/beta hydrolase, partial [Pyrinomonadaceae bacterium]
MLKIIAALLIMTAAGNIFAQTEKSNSESAKIFVNSLGKKDFAAAYALFSDDVKAQVPTEALPQIWAQINVAYGEFRSLKELKKTANAEKLIAVVEFANATQRFQFTFDKQGKILGFVGAPPEESANETVKYETPVYADLGSFTESEVTVGAGGEWALPATLTMPKGKSNVAAAVLVHGSGPNDRDETLGGTKVFKDLAWGLASKGIAVLRYEKRTRQHGAQMGGVKNFTVNEETVEDAVLAARLLMQTPNINPKKVFVLGHSLGGYLLPRIGEKEKTIAGFISFAGATLPLEDIMPKQYAYIFALDGAISPAEQEKIDA